MYSIQVIQGVDRLWGGYAAVWTGDEVRRDHSRVSRRVPARNARGKC